MSEILHFPGSEQTIEILLGAAATSGELALMTLRMPAGSGSPPHRHAQESLPDVRCGPSAVEPALGGGDPRSRAVADRPTPALAAITRRR